jgi:hypothetical protein
MVSTFARSAFIIEVRRQRSDRAASGLACQAGGERLEPRLVAAHQDEVVATLCETVRIDGADAPRFKNLVLVR